MITAERFIGKQLSSFDIHCLSSTFTPQKGQQITISEFFTTFTRFLPNKLATVGSSNFSLSVHADF
jgi:hypothetical protein